MAETLLAILLATTSAKGSNLVFRWPEFPSPSPRLSRARPDPSTSLSQFDNPWRASHTYESHGQEDKPLREEYARDPDYAWPRPNPLRDRSLSFANPSRHTRGGLVSPSSRDRSYSFDRSAPPDEYEIVLGYSAEFLANLLCPHMSMCHQKFELVVDDLAFIGHPVCAEADGGWRFKPEKIKVGSRGRDDRGANDSASPYGLDNPPSANVEAASGPPSSKSAWLTTFHLTLVLDLPDPSSSASGNVAKYFNTLYEQIAYTLTAVLYQEQVLSNFVEKECDMLLALKDQCMAEGESFPQYAARAFEISSIAPAMKTVFEAIKSSSMAYVTINDLPLELQLPPYLDTLLHSQDNDEDADLVYSLDEDPTEHWGEHQNLGWRLPVLAPWKTLLLLDIDNEKDLHMIMGGPQESAEDRNLAEGLVRFLETASITLSLSEMANLLDWDLHSQVYPIIRWLVLHRRAKVVDVVHPGLKTAFTIPPKFGTPLAQLTKEFNAAFTHPAIPRLPEILSIISGSMSKQTDSHFFASIVKSKEYIPMFHDVVLWMLKRDLLVTLHLRIRIVATSELKRRVQEQRELKKAQAMSGIGGSRPRPDIKSSRNPSFLLGSHPQMVGQRFRSNDSEKSEISELNFDIVSTTLHIDEGSASDSSNSEFDEGDSGWDTTEDHTYPSIIDDPGKATPMQRRWLTAMSDGKDPVIAKRFELINQYFDGKRSDDEILYTAEISRKQLRQVLHHYDEYLLTFLHPS
ncbi:hypothetical protein CPC08DRAFT_704721 [Agrocybe pediades]|nr:hypothetical protein CPC08DRAFT_704721 [Agrocybe pediades]